MTISREVLQFSEPPSGPMAEELDRVGKDTMTMLQQAIRARELHGINRVGLSGGVFQNRTLTEQACRLLQAAGMEVCLPEHIPVNDAGISFGQVLEFGMRSQQTAQASST